MLDANDNEPTFDQLTYEANVSENAMKGTQIIRVSATDNDLGANKRIKYGLTQQSTYMYGRLFAIENDTGVVYLVGRLDRETKAVYQLIVAAEDEGLCGNGALCVAF